MCCGCLQYKGNYTPWRCFTSRPEPARDVQLNSGSEEPTSWEVEKKEQDDIFLEFKYKSINGSSPSGDNKIIMLLDTVDKDSSSVYDQARKMVSIIGIEYGELYCEFEKAQKKKLEEKEEKREKEDKAKAKKAKEELLKEQEEERVRQEKEADRDEARALAREKAAFDRENEQIFIKEATKAAVEHQIQKRAEEAEGFAIKKLERELREANKDKDHLSYINFLKSAQLKESLVGLTINKSLK